MNTPNLTKLFQWLQPARRVSKHMKGRRRVSAKNYRIALRKAKARRKHAQAAKVRRSQ
jgi:hypothetical protein